MRVQREIRQEQQAVEQQDLPVRRVGILGGTFDPIHHAHLILAEEVRWALALTEMVFIPAGQPPHKPNRIVTPAHHRLAMVEEAIASNPHFTCSRIEIERRGPSYLVDTLRELHTLWGPGTELSFLMGWDSLEELHTWYQPQEILAQLSQLVAVQRPGHVVDRDAYTEILEKRLPGISQRLRVVAMPQLAISSTDLRHRVTEGRPITYQVPAVVEQYIYTYGLYRSDTQDLYRSDIHGLHHSDQKK